MPLHLASYRFSDQLSTTQRNQARQIADANLLFNPLLHCTHACRCTWCSSLIGVDRSHVTTCTGDRQPMRHYAIRLSVSADGTTTTIYHTGCVLLLFDAAPSMMRHRPMAQHQMCQRCKLLKTMHVARQNVLRTTQANPKISWNAPRHRVRNPGEQSCQQPAEATLAWNNEQKRIECGRQSCNTTA
jgi:hypothetical protein